MEQSGRIGRVSKELDEMSSTVMDSYSLLSSCYFGWNQRYERGRAELSL